MTAAAVAIYLHESGTNKALDKIHRHDKFAFDIDIGGDAYSRERRIIILYNHIRPFVQCAWA